MRSLCFLLLFMCSHSLFAIGLSVSNNQCNGLQLSPSSQILTAGSYFNSDQACSAALHVSGIDATTQWRVSASLNHVTTGLSITVRRTGGGGSLSDGLSAVYINTGETLLFSGTGPVNDIPLEIKIKDIDVSDGNGSVINNSMVTYKVTVI